jgi:toxin ParE1/3/4
LKRLDWRLMALKDRAKIIDHIADDNLRAAMELDDEFALKAELARASPLLYRAGRTKGTREIVVRPHYVMVYRVTPQAIEIVRVLWPSVAR